MKLFILLFTSCFMCLFTFTSSKHSGPGSISVSLSDTPSHATLGETSKQDTLSSTSGQATIPPKQDSVTAEIHASFSDEVKTGALGVGIDQSVLKNINVPAELSETVEELVLTLTGSSLESEVQPNTTDERYVVRAHPRVPGQQAVPEEEDDVPLENTTDSSPQHSLPTTEDIPSFSEWTQQQLAERKRADPNVTERVRNTKVRIKNYASPDCGAKIVAANPEAVSAGSVLSSSRDEYMLNHCTARIWFIVELCEAVQAKQIDLANFELFSSSPKDFSVFLGSRFPSRDWQAVGRFSAEDSRNIQTFDLEPQLFGKYLKVDVHSHYGKEHYCPLSLVRVYGTSEYEVLATEDDRQPDDDDDLAEEEDGSVSRNLFTSATDAVLSIVKKATAPFMKAEQQQQLVPVTPSNCVSPRYLAVCDNCSEHTYDNLFYYLSCQQDSVYKLAHCPFIRRTLVMTDICTGFGLDFVSLREGAPYPSMRPQERENYLSALFKEPFVAALCNALAVLENRVVVNTSMTVIGPKNLTDETNLPSSSPSVSLIPPSSTCVAPDYSITSTQINIPQDHTLSIEPTKTLREEDLKKLPKPKEEAAVIEHTDSGDTVPTLTHTNVVPSVTVTTAKESPISLQEELPEKPPVIVKREEAKEKEVMEPRDSTLDAILQDLSELELVVNQRQPTSATPPPSPPKDSIFLRLANRIKNLELNMSLSSSYLEELSRRYRQQQEVLGQTVNVTATRLEEFIRLDEQRSKRRDDEVIALRAQVAALTKEVTLLLQERNSWLPKFSHMLWFAVELFIIWYAMARWSRPQSDNTLRQPNGSRLPQRHKPNRRNSVEAIPGHIVPERVLERRPSDEALEICTSFSAGERKRKKRRKEGSRKTSAVSIKRKKSEQSLSPEDISKQVVPITRQTSEPPLRSSREDSAPVLAIDLATANRFAAFESPRAPANTNDGHPKIVRRFSSPAFMRTAMSSRAIRSVADPPSDPGPRLKKESGFKKYMKKLF